MKLLILTKDSDSELMARVDIDKREDGGIFNERYSKMV